MQRFNLPIPDAHALAHSEQLRQRLLKRIQCDPQQSISFYQYMNAALYEPQLGYYVSGQLTVGKQGDFITAPELSALFSMSMADYCLPLLAKLTQPIVLELGAGSGKMAADLLRYWQAQRQLPVEYWILEVSPLLQARQYETLKQYVPELLPRIKWLNRLPAQAFNGIIIGNEVLDAMPVEVFTYHQNTYYQQAISATDGEFKLTLRPAPPSLMQALQTLPLPHTEGYTSELNPQLAAWIQALSDCLVHGSLLLVDYGYTQADYYHPERTQGTLLCFYQHRVHDQPLLWTGLQDITASVDFTAVTQAAYRANFQSADYTTQANFLIHHKLETHFNACLAQQPEQLYALAQQVRLLTLPAEMGERFKVFTAQK